MTKHKNATPAECMGASTADAIRRADHKIGTLWSELGHRRCAVFAVCYRCYGAESSKTWTMRDLVDEPRNC
eukprot:214031-Pleurochrysis_carterae.AAC.1